MSIFKKIKNFLFTKKSKPVIVHESASGPDQSLDMSSLEELLEEVPSQEMGLLPVMDEWDPYKENHREEASVHTDLAPKSIVGGALSWMRSSFFSRWYSEKKKIAETGLTTRQRVKRYNSMYEGKTDPRFPSVKEGDGGKSDGQRKTCT